jgi:uncharacterized protein (DUF1778 family)
MMCKPTNGRKGMRTRPIVIACRVTEHERTVLEAAARLERASLAETVRKGALRGAIDRLRAVQPQENTKGELAEAVEEQRAVA